MAENLKFEQLLAAHDDEKVNAFNETMQHMKAMGHEARDALIRAMGGTTPAGDK